MFNVAFFARNPPGRLKNRIGVKKDADDCGQPPLYKIDESANAEMAIL
jgi:hypothetical protein